MFWKSKTKAKPTRKIQIPNKPGDPLSWANYSGQEPLKRRLQLRIEAMEAGAQLKALFYGPFGYGKTALARVLANEMFQENLVDHYIETIGLNFQTKLDVDDFVLRLKPFTFVFIDEIHTLTAGIREAFYTAIQDNWHLPYKKQRRVQLPPGICWVGATTQLGQVHPSLQRRLLPIQLEPLNELELARITQNQKVGVDSDAAELMAKRCTTPWEIKDELYATSEDIVVSRELKRVTIKVVTESCDILGIDGHGLRPRERRVLEALWHSPRTVKSWGWKAYALSQPSLIAISELDKETYVNYVEPKLLRLGFIKVSSIGRELTTEALNTYFGGV